MQSRLELKGDWGEQMLVPLQPRGQKPPLYCFPGINGDLGYFDALAVRLAPVQPLYGLVWWGMDGESPPLTTLSEVVEYCIRVIRAHQPSGPYLLSGFSFGSVVALEVAHALRNQGEQIALLASFDGPMGVTFERPRRKRKTKLAKLIQRANKHRSRMGGLNLIDKSHYAVKRLVAKYRRRALQAQEKNSGNISTQPISTPLVAANFRMLRDYDPPVYGGNVVVFITPPTRKEGKNRVWKTRWKKAIRGGIEFCPIPGEHRTILHEPNVQVLAQKLTGYIERSLATSAS